MDQYQKLLNAVNTDTVEKKVDNKSLHTGSKKT
jgi:hypothetical protein